MPSTYAHYCFGKAVYRRLPQEIQEEIKAYSPLYMTGLHGPDILFYYKPLKSNAINRIGYGMHGRPADEFLKKPGCGQGSCRKEEVDLHISMDLSAILHWTIAVIHILKRR